MIEDACPQRGHYTYSRGLDPGPNRPTKALLLGSIIHKFLELWHGEGKQPSVAFKEVDAEFPIYEAKILLPVALTYMSRYVAVHKDDTTQFRVVATEQRFIVPFDTPKGHRVYLDGIIDMITEDLRTGKLHIWDNKTDSRNLWSSDVLLFDRQLNAYTVIANQLDYDPSVLTVNQIKTSKTSPESIVKAPKEDLFARHSVEVTPSTVAAWRRAIGKRIDQILEAEYIHKALGSHCLTCPYRQACQMELNGVDPEPYLRSLSSGGGDLNIIIDIDDGAFDNA